MAKPFYLPGNYIGRVTRWVFGKNSKGNEQLAVSFDVLGIVNPADPEGPLEPCQVQERTIYLTITEKSIGLVIDSLKGLGYERTSFRFLDPDIEGHHDFAGTEFPAYCKHEEYQDVVREKWGVSSGSGGPQVEPLADKDVRKLDALFSKQLATLAKGGNGAKPEAKPEPEKPAAKPAGRQAKPRETVPMDQPEYGSERDDIPF